MRRRTPALIIAISLLLGGALSGCALGGGTDSVPISHSPSVADYPIVWLETPNLDLNTADGTFVRALAESWYLRSELGPEAYFPGYRQASNRAYLWWDSILPRHDPPHTAYMWIAPFAYHHPQNKYEWKPLSDEIGGVSVCMTSPGTALADSGMLYNYRRTGKKPPTHQHGPYAAPSSNVFGDWEALDFADPTQLLAQKCGQPPSPLPRGIHTSTPGWPDGTSETR